MDEKGVVTALAASEVACPDGALSLPGPGPVFCEIMPCSNLCSSDIELNFRTEETKRQNCCEPNPCLDPKAPDQSMISMAINVIETQAYFN